jgi:hypothetical protein
MPLRQLAATARRLRSDANGVEQRLWHALRADWQAGISAAQYIPHLTLALSTPKGGEGNVEGHDPAIHRLRTVHGWHGWSEA